MSEYPTNSTAKMYQDCEGNDLTLYQMVRREPNWAMSRIQVGEAAIKELEHLKSAQAQAGGVNMTAIHLAINVLTEAKEIFEAPADDIDISLMNVAHRCFCAISGLQQPAQANRQALIDLLVATRTQSEGVTADLIINMLGAKPQVNQQLLEGWEIKKVDADEFSFLVTHPDGSSILLQDGQLGIMAHMFIELCEAIAAAQEQKV